MNRPPERIAIIGAGPAGATAAALLARAGRRVALFDSGHRPPLIVGESLIPAVIPILQRLGIEEEVKSFSVHKPGATFRVEDVEYHYPFADFGKRFPGYAYNTPRDRFDAALLEAAKREGAAHLTETARVTAESGTDRIALDEASAQTAREALGGAPDFTIDATGRRRMFAHEAGIPSHAGQRKDTVLFAHIDRATITTPGNIHIGRLTHGWHWFIPLPGRMSLGVVMDSAAWEQYGATSEERYDTLLAGEPGLTEYARGAARLTPVMKYTNYQMVSGRFAGNGWALVGDAGGFVDPVFSSGLYLTMQGAANLADAVVKGTPAAMRAYGQSSQRAIRTWQRIVDLYYNGTVFALFKVRREEAAGPLMSVIREHVYQHMGRLFTGEAATGRYSIALIELIARYGTSPESADQLKIN